MTPRTRALALSFMVLSSRSSSAYAQTPTPPSVAPAEGQPAFDPAWARVRIFSSDPRVTLERRLGSVPGDPPPQPRSPYDAEFTWKVVCKAPCNAAVQVAGEYRIAGEGVVLTEGFAVKGPYSHLLVDAGSMTVRRAGAWLAIIGFLGAAASGIFVGVQAVKGKGLGTAGDAAIGGLIAGTTIGVGGIGLAASASTSVRDDTRRDLAALPAPRQLGLAATLRF